VAACRGTGYSAASKLLDSISLELTNALERLRAAGGAWSCEVTTEKWAPRLETRTTRPTEFGSDCVPCDFHEHERLFGVNSGLILAPWLGVARLG